MNFDDTPKEAAFRSEARAWIAQNAPHHLRGAIESSGIDALTLPGTNIIEAQKAWQKRKFDAGWACPHWPRAYRGRDATPVQYFIWQQEEGPYARLSRLFHNGIGMCAPTLIAFAAESQKQSLLPNIASGTDVWCQLFSEPAAGSDLAGLRTRAVRDGDGWIVNGQKVWTSFAQHAQKGLLLARTDGSVPKHRGLTMFFIDMQSPGVEVRPIRQISGQTDFNEVYLSDVRIPDAQRLGTVNDGWRVSLTTLMNERLAIGMEMPTGFDAILDYCRNLRTDRGLAAHDPRIQSRLAQWYIRAHGLRYIAMGAITQLSKGWTPGPENSITKLVAGEMMQDIAEFALDLQAEKGVLAGADGNLSGLFQAMLLRAPGTRIEGGTDEILRNIIAERVLGLPGDVRVDKDNPFDSIPIGPRKG
ncbi:MAG: acyl-CoA dehydrogenase family protein [Rhizomicrobium sp.]